MHSSRKISLVHRFLGTARYLRAHRRFVAFLIALICIARPSLASGDEAILLDGSKRPGELHFRDGAFQFLPSGQTTALLWTQLDRVVLTETKRLPLAPPFWWQAIFTNGDSLACQLIEVESNAIICDSTWFQGLRARRSLIRAFERPLGWAPWLRQDFTKEGSAVGRRPAKLGKRRRRSASVGWRSAGQSSRCNSPLTPPCPWARFSCI